MNCLSSFESHVSIKMNAVYYYAFMICLCILIVVIDITMTHVIVVPRNSRYTKQNDITISVAVTTLGFS